MAKRRLMKKSLQVVMGELFTASIVASMRDDADAQKVHEVQGKIISAHSDFNARLTHYDRKNAKAYFRQYREDVAKALDGIIGDLEPLLKEE